MTTLTVQAESEAGRAGEIDGVVASLPLSLRHDLRRDGAKSADLVAIAGTPGWSERAHRAVAAGAKGLMVVDPIAEDCRALRADASAQSVPIVIDRPMSGNPAVALAAPAFADIDGEDRLVECRFVSRPGTDPARILLDQFALLAVIMAPVRSAIRLASAEHGYQLRAVLASGQRCVISAVLTRALPVSAWVRVLGATGAVEIILPEPISARPGMVVSTTAGGSNLSPTLYETSHRAAWRRLCQLAVDHQPAVDLDRLLADADVVESMTVRTG